MYKFNLIDKVSFILVIIGALNWGLYGLFTFDLVGFVFGSNPPTLLARIVYIMVGVAGANLMFLIYKSRKSLKK